jgi:hypothetical protein
MENNLVMQWNMEPVYGFSSRDICECNTRCSNTCCHDHHNCRHCLNHDHALPNACTTKDGAVNSHAKENDEYADDANSENKLKIEN